MADQIDDYSYLDEDHTDDGFGDFELSARDIALAATLPVLDYASQLLAIRDLLDRQRNAEAEHATKVREAEQYARNPPRTRNPDPSIAALEDIFRQQHLIDQLHYSIFQDAAHSMAAVGLLAPFLESFFYQSFRLVGREMMIKSLVPSDHERWQHAGGDKWDCHFVWENGRRVRSLVEGILQLVDAVDMNAHMPEDLQVTLAALFTYRNKMFHCGLEWPLKERKRFEQELSQWPDAWFSRATSSDGPWVFYMSAGFVTHCLDRTEQIIEGIGRFRKERLR